MYIFLSVPKINTKEHFKINQGFNPIKPPWLWGWNKPINETQEYWILEKSKEKYVIVYKKNHTAYCYYNGKMCFYARATNFCSNLPNHLTRSQEWEDLRIEVHEINKKIKQLQEEKNKFIKSMSKEDLC